jgi:hypothetical protein
MTAHRSSSRALALLEQFLPDNDPLVGDLIERSHERSSAWLWRQVILAVVVRAAEPLRANPRMAAEQALVATALLALLGFHAVVGATLMHHLLGLESPPWSGSTGVHAWQPYAAMAAFALAAAIGRAIGRFHRGHRVLTAIACSASATAAAFLNLYLFGPQAGGQPFVAEPAPPIAAAMVFIAGMFVGIGSRSKWDAVPSH